MLHGHGRGLSHGDILGDTVHRQILSGEMGRVVQTGLGLRLVGGGADCQITRVRIGGGFDVALIRVEQIPVIGFGREFGRTGGVVRGGVIHHELGVVRVRLGAGGSVEDIQGVVLLPLGGHAVVDGPGVDVAEDNPDGHAVETADIGFLVTADERKGGRSQTREEKRLFHRSVLYGSDFRS